MSEADTSGKEVFGGSAAESSGAPRNIGCYHFAEVDDDNPWEPSLNEFDPGISTEAWLELLQEPGLLEPDYGIVLRRWYEYGSPCTPSEIAEECGELSARAYRTKLSTVGTRAILKGAAEPMAGRTNGTGLPLLIQRRKMTDKNRSGSVEYQLRPELVAALDQLDMSAYPFSEPENED